MGLSSFAFVFGSMIPRHTGWRFSATAKYMLLQFDDRLASCGFYTSFIYLVKLCFR